MSLDEPGLIRALASQYGFSISDLEAAIATLELPPGDFSTRFTNLVQFAKTYGVSVKALADFVASTTSGIAPWPPPDRPGRPEPLTAVEHVRVREVRSGR